MFSTIIFSAIFLGLLLISAVLWGLFLRIGLRWAKAQNITGRRIALVTSIIIVLNLALSFFDFIVSGAFERQYVVLQVAQIVVSFVVPCLLIMCVFKVRALRALQAWLPTIAAPILTVAFSILVLRSWVYESYFVPTNAMAPTLVGEHWKGLCPQCGLTSYCTVKPPAHPADRYSKPQLPRMICDNFHISDASNIEQKPFERDHFLVAKFLPPRRWDMIVFRYPEQPTMIYVSRLVGFPGEVIEIKDGAVWADGKPLALPDSMREIKYSDKLPELDRTLWGSRERPAQLGKDEYFVLGDFTTQSSDSRLWELGDHQHHPFAVPKSHIRGVVTHTYLPLNRLRIHR